MENLIPHPTHPYPSTNTSYNSNQAQLIPRSKQSTLNTSSYRNVPPPPPETRTLNSIPSTNAVLSVPPPPMQPNLPSSSFSTIASQPQPVYPNVPARPYEQTGVNRNKSIIGDRLKRLAYSSPQMQIDDDKKFLVENLCGILECMEKW